MIVHSDRRHANDYVRRYNGLNSSKIGAIIPKVEHDIVGRQDIVLCRRRELIDTGSERFDTIPVTHRVYGPLSYVLNLPRDTD